MCVGGGGGVETLVHATVLVVWSQLDVVNP